MKTNIKNRLLLLSLLSTLSCEANSLKYEPTFIHDENNVSQDSILFLSAIKSNSNRISVLTEEVKSLQSKINKLTENQTKRPNAIVVNVKHYANFRDIPNGKIFTHIPLGLKIHVDFNNCVSVKNITWCKSSDFGGGFISKYLVQQL